MVAGAGPTRRSASVSVGVTAAQDVAAVFKAREKRRDFGMSNRCSRVVKHQVLLGNIGDIGRLIVFSEQVVIRLVLGGTHLFGNRLPPFLGIGEDGIDIIDHAPERVVPVVHDIPDLELRSPEDGGFSRCLGFHHGKDVAEASAETKRLPMPCPPLSEAMLFYWRL